MKLVYITATTQEYGITSGQYPMKVSNFITHDVSVYNINLQFQFSVVYRNYYNPETVLIFFPFI